MITRILEIIESLSLQWIGESLRRSDLDYFYTSGNPSATGKILLFVFKKKHQTPFMVVKISRSPRYAYSVKKEYDNLREISSSSGDDLGIPQPYYYGDLNGTSFLIEPYLPGRSLYKDFITYFNVQDTAAEADKMLDKALTWLRQFHKCSAKCLPISEIGDRYRLSDYNSFHVDSRSPVWIGSLQGDYWIGNILLNNDRVNVVDWEWSESRLPIVWDIFFFAFTLLRHAVICKSRIDQPAALVTLLRADSEWIVDLLKLHINRHIAFHNCDVSIRRYLITCCLQYVEDREFKRYGIKTAECEYWGQVRNLVETGNSVKDLFL